MIITSTVPTITGRKNNKSYTRFAIQYEAIDAPDSICWCNTCVSLSSTIAVTAIAGMNAKADDIMAASAYPMMMDVTSSGVFEASAADGGKGTTED